jgi:hypothetical protein
METIVSKKIGVLIPTTSRGRPEWKKVSDTYLFKYTLTTFLQTRSLQHKYTFYIGIDDDDRIMSHLDARNIIYNFKTIHENISFKFISMKAAKKGHLTKMWNILFQYAYEQGCEYFLQCGDDINFKSMGWVDDAIQVLKKNNDIGITAPICNNPTILTQSFVSRKHMEIFGWYFPEEIANWFCDNWINAVYKPNHLFPLYKHICSNDGGAVRYLIGSNGISNAGTTSNFLDSLKNSTNTKENLDILCKEAYNLASTHKQLIEKYLHK